MINKVRNLLKIFFKDDFQDLTDQEISDLLAFTQDFRPSCLPEEEQDLAQVYYILYLLISKLNKDRGNINLKDIKSMTIGEQTIGVGTNIDAGISTPYDASYWFDKWKNLNSICNIGGIFISEPTKKICGC